MIDSIELHNFQSHKHSALEFAPGVNVIIGSSDSGKTAVIRALRWLVWNRPLGDAIRSTWGGETSVEVSINNSSVYRSKDKADQYRLGKTEFKAFGTTVPEEIIKTLNLNEINLQSQLDAPFLLSNSPGDVAKHFNRVAHLDQIDLGSKNVQSWLREIEHSIASDVNRKANLEEELTQYDHLNKFEMEVEILERLHTDMITQVNQKRELTSVINELIEINEQIEDQAEILKDAPLVNNLLKWIGERKEKEVTRNKLQSLIKNITETEAAGRYWKSKAELLHEEFDTKFPDRCPLCNKPK